MHVVHEPLGSESIQLLHVSQMVDEPLPRSDPLLVANVRSKHGLVAATGRRPAIVLVWSREGTTRYTVRRWWQHLEEERSWGDIEGCTYMSASGIGSETHREVDLRQESWAVIRD